MKAAVKPSPYASYYLVDPLKTNIHPHPHTKHKLPTLGCLQSISKQKYFLSNKSIQNGIHREATLPPLSWKNNAASKITTLLWANGYRGNSLEELTFCPTERMVKPAPAREAGVLASCSTSIPVRTPARVITLSDILKQNWACLYQMNGFTVKASSK